MSLNHHINKIPKSVTNTFSLTGTVLFVFNTHFNPFSINILGVIGIIIFLLGNLVRYSLLYAAFAKQSSKPTAIALLLYMFIVFVLAMFYVINITYYSYKD